MKYYNFECVKKEEPQNTVLFTRMCEKGRTSKHSIVYKLLIACLRIYLAG